MTTQFTSKQPYEAFAISFDFASVLVGGETISTAVITAVDQSTLVDVSTDILDIAKQSKTTTVVFGWVRAGTSGHSYLITCRISGSAGSLYELEGILPVVELGAEIDPTINPPLATLSSLITDIQEILQDSAYTDIIITDRINVAVARIAGGIRMPSGEVSPPLPDLYAFTTVLTSITLPHVSLPANYQRNVVNIYDSSFNRIAPPRGGDYYAFAKFMKQISNFSLAEAGSIYRVCVKGTKLYYQGIPSVSTTLGVHYYRKPVAMTDSDDTPDGIPEHLQVPLIKHYVCKEIMGEKIEDGQDNSGIGTKYHTGKFFEAMIDLVDFVGIDATPQYYGSGSFEDAGICD